MRYNLLILLLFFPWQSWAQESWPLNSRTGKVEFIGALSWPARDTTAAQRQAIVRKWYESKLINTKLPDIDEAELFDIHIQTCCNLPTWARLRYIRKSYSGTEYLLQLDYRVQLTIADDSLHYRLFDFGCDFIDDDVGSSFSLEDELQKRQHRAFIDLALIKFRKQLSSAIASW